MGKVKTTGCIKMAFRLLIFGLSMVLFSLSAKAQKDSTDIYDLTLAELSKLQISSASKISQNINEIPSTIFIITATRIKERGYLTLEEALSDLPGFQFRNILGMNSYVFQRGIPNQNNLTLILVDGVQINELNSGGFYAGGQYNLSNVDRIEVIYGPSSVAYGTNAVAGIINIITKSAREKKTGINVLAGNFKTTAGDFVYSNVNKEKTFGISVSGMFKRSDKADLKGAAGSNNWTSLLDNFENDYALDIKTEYKEFTLGLNYILKQSSTATNYKSVGTIYKDFGSLWNIQFINSYLKYNKSISEKLSLSAVLYNRNTTVLRNSVYYVVDTARIGYYRPNNLMGLENVLNYKANRFFSLTTGLTFEFDQLAKQASLSVSPSLEDKPPRPADPEMLKNYLLSVFAEPRFTLVRNLFLSGGIRFDYSSVYEQVFTPRAGISYQFRKHLMRISYAEAFRAPKPWDFADGLGNSSLLPEKMRSLELAFTFSIIDKIKIDVVGYKNFLLNSITKELTDTIGNYRWVNSGKINTYGAEFSIRVEFGKFKSTLNYTYTQSKSEPGVFVPEISRHCGNVSMTYSFNDNIKVNLRANYVGRRQNPQFIAATNSFNVDPYFILHSTVSLLNYKGITVQVSVKNLLNTTYYHTSNRLPDRYRQPQSTILLTAGYSLNK
ncbi:MAG TPA: TonB-dependent receptor [Bacteroidales bacterium]|nr:TonB-dependent receptor [Bacteroidales bacterium]